MRAAAVAGVVILLIAIGSPTSADDIDGTDFFDILYGTNSDDTIDAFGETDYLFGRLGDDVMRGGAGEDWMFPGAGLDKTLGGGQEDWIFEEDTTPGDVLRGEGGPDKLRAFDGESDKIDCGDGVDFALGDPDDQIAANCETVVTSDQVLFARTFKFGTDAGDTIIGTNGHLDELYGGRGPDTIKGREGSDIIAGGPGRDVVLAGNDPDIIVDADGTAGDRLFGGPDNDTLFSVDGRPDEIDCGGGRDTAFVDAVDTVAANCEDVRAG